MAVATNKLVSSSAASDIKYSSSILLRHSALSSSHEVTFRKLSAGNIFGAKPRFSCDSLQHICHCSIPKQHCFSCKATGTQNECVRRSEDCLDSSRHQTKGVKAVENCSQFDDEALSRSSAFPNQGLAEACKFVHNDAKFVNERARKDIVLISRGLTRLNDRARQDVQFLGLEFLKLDARAREDTVKIDSDVKKKAAHLHHIATILKDKAQSDLKRAADQHWSDGALEADLQRANFLVRRRAMEDAFMALKFVRNIHDMMVNKMYQQPRKEGALSVNKVMGYITLKRNGKAIDLFPGEVSTDRITAIQDAYWSMASALSEADGIDYTDPDELELLVATLIDLDAMDGKSTVSLLADCASSPDVNTRKALANALATAPSMWILGNAGMGALKRLAEDRNPAVAAAASKAIDELRRQWELEEGDSLQFMVNKLPQEADEIDVDPNCQ
uniref:Tetratricopeptide repeat protein 27 n=2 Tax=Anthurium amnicola TaxID=1678845 RepID=A0A1D1XMI5_9ARAE